MAFRCQEHPQCPGQRAIEFRDGRADVSLFDLGEMVEPMGFEATTFPVSPGRAPSRSPNRLAGDRLVEPMGFETCGGTDAS